MFYFFIKSFLFFLLKNVDFICFLFHNKKKKEFILFSFVLYIFLDIIIKNLQYNTYVMVTIVCQLTPFKCKGRN